MEVLLDREPIRMLRIHDMIASQTIVIFIKVAFAMMRFEHHPAALPCRASAREALLVMRRGVPWSDTGTGCCPSPEPADSGSLVLLSSSGGSSNAAPATVGSSLRFVRLRLAPCGPVDPLPAVPPPPLWATAITKRGFP